MLVAGMVVVVLLGVFFGVPYLAHRSETSDGGGSTSGGPFGVFEEIFHPAAHDANIVRMEQKERVAPAPTPADGDDDDEEEAEPDLDSEGGPNQAQ